MSSQTPIQNKNSDDQQQSIGQMLSTAVNETSNLVNSQIELAKAELRQSAQKGMAAGIAGIVALILASVMIVFIFLTIAFVLFIWLPLWAAFGITTLLLLAMVAICGLIVKKKVEGIKGPEQTIESVQTTKEELVSAVKPEHHSGSDAKAATPVVPNQASGKPTTPSSSSKGTS